MQNCETVTVDFPLMILRSAFEERRCFIQQDKFFPFNIIRETSMLIAMVSQGSVKDPFVTIDIDQKGVCVGGLPIRMKTVRDGIHAGIAKASGLLDHLLCGVPLKALRDKIEAIHDPSNQEFHLPDNLHSRTLGYCSLTAESSPLHKHRFDLFRALMSSEKNTITGERKLYTRDYSGKVHLNVDEVAEFFKRADAFVEVSHWFAYRKADEQFAS